MNGKQGEGMWRRSQTEVERLVAEYEASGLGRQTFCEKDGLSLSTARRLPKTGLCNELVVVLSSGRRIEVRGAFNTKVLQQLVRVLEQV
jgi:hypothetical protein